MRRLIKWTLCCNVWSSEDCPFVSQLIQGNSLECLLQSPEHWTVNVMQFIQTYKHKPSLFKSQCKVHFGIRFQCLTLQCSQTNKRGLLIGCYVILHVVLSYSKTIVHRIIKKKKKKTVIINSRPKVQIPIGYIHPNNIHFFRDWTIFMRKKYIKLRKIGVAVQSGFNLYKEICDNLSIQSLNSA